MRRGLTSVAIFIAFVVILTLSRHVIDPHLEHHDDERPGGHHHDRRVYHDDDDGDGDAATCPGSAFAGVFNEGEGAAGTIYASVTLTKHSAGTCSIKGWPILTLQDKTGAVLPVNLVDESGTE